MALDFYSAVKARRSVYTLSSKATVSDSRIEEILKDALLHVPSPFNSQSGRIVLLRGAKHDAFWSHLKEILRGIVNDPKSFADTEAKVDGFKAGYGTVLFFEDEAVVKDLQERFSFYEEKFPQWSLNSTGMMQFVVWTSFAVEGMGASLQHYTPLMDEWVYKNADVPASWKMIAQMPFGVSTAPAGEKTFGPLSGRFKVVQ